VTGRARPIVAAAILGVASLLLFWPGVAMYDTVSQYEQVVTGQLTDWHPPVMARLWQLLAVFGPGTAPIFVPQIALYWGGIALLAGALAGCGRARAALATVVIGLCPVFLGWQAVVLKDSQMLGAMLAATGLIGWWRLAGRPVPRWAWVLAAVLIAYATLVRANAVFATVPFVAMLPLWSWPRRLGAGLAGVALVLGLSGPINHRLLGAEATDVTRTLPIFDLAGITAMGGRADGLTPAERAAILRAQCYKPFFWDPLGDDGHCGDALDRLHNEPAPDLFHAWVSAVVTNPIAYAMHRIAHLNETDRFLTPANRPSAAPASFTDANPYGLKPIGKPGVRFQQLGAWVAASPLGWPIAYIALGLALLIGTARAPATPERRLARALLVSALTLEASFGVVSIASDLRYHLWAMVAVALATILLASAGLTRRAALAVLGAVLLTIGAGTAARVILPPGPASYRAML